MLFSYESAMRELKRLNDSGGEGMYRMVKRWYGWVIAENYFGNFNMDDGIEIDTKLPPLAMLQRIYDEAHEHKDKARTANDILKLIKELESVSVPRQDLKQDEKIEELEFKLDIATHALVEIGSVNWRSPMTIGIVNEALKQIRGEA